LTQAVLPATASVLLGLFVLLGVGFAGPATIHNAAHDSRHAFAFPCH
jgi:cobalt transporter subunit CbtB